MRIAVTGGTGSFGRAFTAQAFQHPDIEHVTIISRDEFKQFHMAKAFASHPITFKLGDVRDRDAMFDLVKDVDCVFHAAALKHVTSCQEQPLEAVKTNILGTQNVLDAASHNGVKNLVFLSTDKAVYPINAMGMSKGMAERLLLGYSDSPTKMNIVRYGNVVPSRGSVIPLWIKQIREKEVATITDIKMTRFLFPIDTAVELVMTALKSPIGGRIFVAKSSSADMGMLLRALYNIYRKMYHGPVAEKISVIGARKGEKLHETLITLEEAERATDMTDYFMIEKKAVRSFEPGIFLNGCKEVVSNDPEYRLEMPELTEFLETLPEVMGLFTKEMK